MKILSTLVLVVTLVACNTNPKNLYSGIDIDSDNLAMASPKDHPGKRLMENNCYVCHNPKTSKEGMIAPPMIAVKMHYINNDTTKESFINEVMAFLKNPSEEKSKMPGAIKKFGLMPYQFYPENTIKQIADYMFDHEIEEPEWFDDHYSKMHGERPRLKGLMGNEKGKGMGMRKNQSSSSPQPSTEERGMQMAQTTKAELGKNLMGQIQKNGVIAALDFCNIQAIPLTDSMSVEYKAQIRRVSDKPRNQKNQANAVELTYIQKFKNQIAANEEPTPIVTTMGKKVEFYYPIITNSMCLKCHGTPEKEIEKLTLAKILEHYPNDKATGYVENEVRGIWSIHW